MIVSFILFVLIVLMLVFLREIKSKNTHKDDNGTRKKIPGIATLLKSAYEMIFKVKNDGK